MLEPLLVSLGLAVIGAMIVAAVTRVALRHLALDLADVLLWLGLAESPTDELSVRRRAEPRARLATARVRPSSGR